MGVKSRSRFRYSVPRCGTAPAAVLFRERELHYAFRTMRRKVIAITWILGATVPLLLATVFLVGCCVLPFHQVAHKLMPICDMAASMMRGDAHAEHEAMPPAPEKQEPVKRMVTRLTNVFRLAAATAPHTVVASNATTAYRSFISLGAIRCDRDVGLHVLVETFLI